MRFHPVKELHNLHGLKQTAEIKKSFAMSVLVFRILSSLLMEIDSQRRLLARAGAEIWVADAQRAVMTRLTRGGLDATGPVWSPDGRMVAFSSQASGNRVYIFNLLMEASNLNYFTHKQIVTFAFVPGLPMAIRCSWNQTSKGNRTAAEIWMLDVATKKAASVLSDPTATLRSPVLSPDGLWLAYASDESGRNQLYVRPYPAMDRKWQISQNGLLTQSNFFALVATTYLPHWRNDGRELLYISLNGSVEAASIETEGGNLSATELKTLFKPSFPLIAIAASPDHTKFLAAIVPGDVTSEPIHVVLSPPGN